MIYTRLNVSTFLLAYFSMRAASQLAGKGFTDVDDAPAPAH